MEEAGGDTQYEPYRTSHATGRWDPARTSTLVNGNANVHANGGPRQDMIDPLLTPPTPPIPPCILANGQYSLSGIAVRSFSLGLTMGLCTFATGTLLLYGLAIWRLPFFFVALALFHYLEYYTTARWNTPAAELDAFLLTSNGSAYNMAHALAAVETTVTHSIFAYPTLLSPQWDVVRLGVGLVLLVVGQVARSTAMAQAGTNFNHKVQHQRKSDHELVTTGIYGLLRHPSYFGFFWWALGSQIVLGNVICFVAYAVVLWQFFSRRVRGM
jgi:protein-S-isoprenylcysteine O-methyltransferase